MTLRARLATLGILSFLALIAAAASVLVVARTTDQQRVERTQEGISDAIELMRERVAEHKPPPVGRFGFAGVIEPDGRQRWPARDLPRHLQRHRNSLRHNALRSSSAVFERVEVEVDGAAFGGRYGGRGGRYGARSGSREGVLVLGARALPDRSVLWIARFVPMAPGLRRGRAAVLVLVLAALTLVAAAMRTLAQVQRDTASLQRSLKALGSDLSAEVESPMLGELARVADGLRDLAQARAHAEAERVRLEGVVASKERLAALGRVVAGVAHEVRNPLASMKLKVDLARMQSRADAPLDADLRELGEEITRLDRLITDLLVVSGRRSGPVAPCDLGGLLAKRAALLDAWAEQHAVTIETAGEARAKVDADGIARVIDNLLRNAVQASPRGAVVRARARAEGGRVVIEVEDRGDGVDPARAGELFEPFFTTRAEGTGLGLAMSRAVAEAHEGTLRYERVDGATRFTLTLPA